MQRKCILAPTLSANNLVRYWYLQKFHVGWLFRVRTPPHDFRWFSTCRSPAQAQWHTLSIVTKLLQITDKTCNN